MSPKKQNLGLRNVAAVNFKLYTQLVTDSVLVTEQIQRERVNVASRKRESGWP